MSVSNAAMTPSPELSSSTRVGTASAFWERFRRTSGIQFVAFSLIKYLVQWSNPVGASVHAPSSVAHRH